jgi:hypothetical protein
MNIRETTRMANKNLKSISRIITQLVEPDLLESRSRRERIFTPIILNTSSEIVDLLMQFFSQLRGVLNER